MNTLIISSTKAEIGPIIENRKLKTKQDFFSITSNCDCLITGVGMVATTFSLTKLLNFKSYDFVLQVGIAGSYNTDLQLGEVVEVVKEQFGDLGAEDKEGNFLSLKDLALETDQMLKQGLLQKEPSFDKLPPVQAISVNKVAGEASTIEQRKSDFNADIESMEGIALFYTAEQFNLRYAQVRSISNYVEVRNKENWKTQLAIENLCTWIETNVLL